MWRVLYLIECSFNVENCAWFRCENKKREMLKARKGEGWEEIMVLLQCFVLPATRACCTATAIWRKKFVLEKIPLPPTDAPLCAAAHAAHTEQPYNASCLLCFPSLTTKQATLQATTDHLHLLLPPVETLLPLKKWDMRWLPFRLRYSCDRPVHNALKNAIKTD